MSQLGKIEKVVAFSIDFVKNGCRFCGGDAVGFYPREYLSKTNHIPTYWKES